MKTIYSLILSTFLFASPLFSADPMRIMVSRFSNTGSSNDWIAAGIEDSVINDLKKIKDVVVTSSDARQRALKEMAFHLSGLVDEAQQVKIGEIVGANVILTGNFTVVDDKIRVTARLVNVEKQDVLSSAKIDGEVSKIFDVQDRVVIEILNSMNAEKKSLFAPVTVGEEEKSGFTGKQNLSLPAYQLYAKALNVAYSDMPRALDYFNQAIAQDPNYVEAYMRAAALCAQMSQFDQAEKMLASALKILQAKKAEKSANMSYFYLVAGSLRLQQYKFQDAEKNLRLSMQLQDQLKLKKTVSYLSTSGNLASALMSMGKLAEAKAQLDVSKALLSELKLDKSVDAVAVNVSLGNLNYMGRKYDAALGYYEEAERIAKSIHYEKTKFMADTLGNKGEVLYIMKDLAKAMDCKQRGYAILKEIGQDRTELASYLLQGIGSLHVEAGKKAEAISAYELCQEIRRELKLQETQYYKAVANALKVLKK